MKTIRTFLQQCYQSTAVRLFLLAFIVYNANLRSITSFDTNATRYLPISILKELNLDLDEFSFLHKYSDGRKEEADVIPYYLQYVRGHYVSTYPVMPAILSVPIYAVPVFLGLTEGSVSAGGWSQTEVVGTFLSKISASFAVAFSVGILYLALLCLTSKSSSIWIALIYGFATSSWSISSQGLWQTAFSQPMLALTLYFLIKARESVHNISYASIPLALAVTCRPPNIVFAVIFFIYILHQYRFQIRHFIIFPIILGGLFLTYNLYYFGTLTGGYSGMTEHMFHYPSWKNLCGLLVSPNRGILIFSPILVFAFIGLFITLFCSRDHLLRYTAIGIVLMILFYSSWEVWHGSFSFGNRFLVDLLPGLCLLLPSILNHVFKYKWSKCMFGGFVFFSIFVQIIGTFFYPCGWHDTPVSVSLDSSRFWDWGDMQIFRCLQAGPVYPEGLQFLERCFNEP